MHMLRQGCFLRCSIESVKNCMGVLGWVDWACPISCTCLFYFKPKGVKENPIPFLCKLNLPIFLFSVGLLTLMYIDPLIVLALLWSSLPIIWKLSWVVVWPVLLLWLCIRKGSFRCSLNLSPKVLEVSPMYSSSQARSPHWNQ